MVEEERARLAMVDEEEARLAMVDEEKARLAMVEEGARSVMVEEELRDGSSSNDRLQLRLGDSNRECVMRPYGIITFHFCCQSGRMGGLRPSVYERV
jgi:hypothetical protein